MDRKTVLLLIVSVLILLGMLYFVGIEQVIAALKMADLNLIALAIGVQLFTYFLYTWRWNGRPGPRSRAKIVREQHRRCSRTFFVNCHLSLAALAA